jgi:protein TonB
MTAVATSAPAFGAGTQRAARYGVQRLSPTALGLVLAAHAGVWVALQSLGVVSLPTEPRPLMVELLQSAVIAPKVPEITPPKPPVAAPKPAPVSRAAPRPDVPELASESSRAEPAFEVAKAEKAPVAPAPASAAQATAPAAPAAAAPAAPVPSAPRFDAAYLDNPAPNYPPLSRRAREEGKVVLKVFVEASGLAAKLEVHSSSGFDRLDRSALSAVARWKFVPAKQGTEAVAAWVLVPIVFSLKE